MDALRSNPSVPPTRGGEVDRAVEGDAGGGEVRGGPDALERAGPGRVPEPAGAAGDRELAVAADRVELVVERELAGQGLPQRVAVGGGLGEPAGEREGGEVHEVLHLAGEA